MTSPKLAVSAAIIFVAASALAPAQNRLRPGLYEVTVEMTFTRKPKLAMKAADCLTAEVLKDLTKLLASAADEEECKVSGLVTVGDRMTFTSTCTVDGAAVTSRAELNYGVDSYSGVMTTKADGEVITTKMSGKRIGECPKER